MHAFVCPLSQSLISTSLSTPGMTSRRSSLGASAIVCSALGLHIDTMAHLGQLRIGEAGRAMQEGMWRESWLHEALYARSSLALAHALVHAMLRTNCEMLAAHSHACTCFGGFSDTCYDKSSCSCVCGCEAMLQRSENARCSCYDVMLMAKCKMQCKVANASVHAK